MNHDYDMKLIKIIHYIICNDIENHTTKNNQDMVCAFCNLNAETYLPSLVSFFTKEINIIVAFNRQLG